MPQLTWHTEYSVLLEKAENVEIDKITIFKKHIQLTLVN